MFIIGLSGEMIESEIEESMIYIVMKINEIF